jgi:hypothetical protein
MRSGTMDSKFKEIVPSLVVIHNGTFAYQLVLLEQKPKRRVKRMIYFTGLDNADYFESLYKGLGCEVRRTGDGSEDYATWVFDHGEEK